MRHVLTLIAGTDGPPVDDSIIAAAAAALGAAGGEAGGADVLAPGRACDVPFGGVAPELAEDAVRRSLGSIPIDVAVQPREGRKKRLLAADMDSTLIENEIVDDIAAAADLTAQIAPITARAVAGDVDFAASLRERVALMKGLDHARYLSALGAIRFVPGARELIATMRRAGAYTMIISGGFRDFTGHVRAALGMSEDAANDVEIAVGALTGKLRGPIVGGESKAEILTAAAERLGIPISQTMAVGDGANDRAMLRAAGLGVAFRAKPVLRGAAGARIDHADLTALLYLQGYREAEILRV